MNCYRTVICASEIEIIEIIAYEYVRNHFSDDIITTVSTLCRLLKVLIYLPLIIVFYFCLIGSLIFIAGIRHDG